MRITSLLVALLLTPLACAPPPAEAPPPDVPAPVDEITFVIEVHGPITPNYPIGRPYARQVSLTLTAIEADGDIAEVVDPETGTLRPGPLFIIRTTPWRHVTALGPGVVSVSLTAIYLGVRDDRLSCYIEKDGAEVPGTRQEQSITTAGGSARGGTQVICVY